MFGIRTRGIFASTATVLILAGATPSLAWAAAPMAQPVQSAAMKASAYRIGPEDKLDITVLNVAELTRSVQVDATGAVLLPLVGQIKASGLTPSEFSDRLAAELQEKYMKNPQVTVAVKEASSQRVTVDGAVIQPGIYPIVGATTLLQAVALAKGPDPREANVRKVLVFRTADGQRTSTSFDLKAIREGQVSDPLIYGNDVIVVANSPGRSFLRDIGGLSPLTSLLRPW